MISVSFCYWKILAAHEGGAPMYGKQSDVNERQNLSIGSSSVPPSINWKAFFLGR